MSESREYGTVRNFEGITDELIREIRVHFDILCERHSNSPWVELQILDDGKITCAVREP